MAGHDWHAASDAELLACFVAGRDQRAFAEIVRRHGPMVQAAARRLLRHEHDAEDAFQATFLALASAAGRLRSRDALAAWLHQTAVRSAKSVGRMNARWTRAGERRKEEVEESYTNEPWDDIREVLDDELQRLPSRYRAAIVLCDLEGLSRKEAASRLDMPLATVCSLVVRGRKRLRSRLARRGVAVSTAGLAASIARSTTATASIDPAVVQQTTRHALLFAAGKPATEAGISTTVIHSAQGVLRAMTITKLTMVGALALAVTFSAGGLGGVANIMTTTAQAETILFDDFSNPNPTSADREPARWVPFDSTVSIVDGSLEINSSSPTLVAAAGPAGVNLDDVSVRTQVRSTQGAPAVRLRYIPGAADRGYYAFLSPNGGTGISISGDNPRNILTGQTEFRPADEDVLMQFEAIGNQLSLYLWRPGDPFPSAPLLTTTDETIPGPGGVQIGLTSLPASVVSGSFRFIHVADASIPEPSAGLLAVVSLGAVLVVRLRRKKA